EVAAVDRACSRFRVDSELERVNTADGRPTEVGPVLLDAVEVALQAARQTDGDVDPTVGEALRVLGYDRDFDAVPRNGRPLVRVADWHGAGPEAQGETVRVDGGGVATSSTTVRRWSRGDEEMHHVVDPATGRPTTVVWRTVSVAAATCVDANVAATAAIVRGERSPAWLRALDLPARLVRPDGTVVRVGGWPIQEAAA